MLYNDEPVYLSIPFTIPHNQFTSLTTVIIESNPLCNLSILKYLNMTQFFYCIISFSLNYRPLQFTFHL